MNEKLPSEQKTALDMGSHTSEVFAGKVESPALKEMYSESADFFVAIIKSRLDMGKGPYSLADLGSFRGELLQNVLQKLPEKVFEPVVVGINRLALQENAAKRKVVADLERIPLGDHSVDIALVRYVLQLNNLEKQKEIVKEVARVIKKFAIIQHLGADNVDTGTWRSQVNNALSSSQIPKLTQQGRFYSSRDEVEQFMNEEHVSFERVQDRVVQHLSDVYISRYGLNAEEAVKVRELLGNKDFIAQTTWLLYPNLRQ